MYTRGSSLLQGKRQVPGTAAAGRLDGQEAVAEANLGAVQRLTLLRVYAPAMEQGRVADRFRVLRYFVGVCRGLL